MELNEDTVATFNLDHLGIVAGMCEELKIAERIDALVDGSDPRRIVSCGKAVVAMILNGLGFVNRTLYMAPRFFSNLPVQRLVGENITADNLNDDALGKCLDEIAEFGATELFANVAFGIGIEHNLLGQMAHVDSTSISMEGEYKSQSESAINITHGFAKQRPDLKQFMIQMVVSGPANLPFWVECLDGNSSDKKTFAETIQTVEAFKQGLSETSDFKWIGDSALYTEESLLQIKGYLWTSRVPENIVQAKKIISTSLFEGVWVDHSSGYKYQLHESNYAGIAQRWLLVHSEQAYELESKTFNKRLEKMKEACEKELWHLKNTAFSCQKEAETAWKKCVNKNKFFSIFCSFEERSIYAKKGRPSIKNPEIGKSWHIISEPLMYNEDAVSKELASKGRFILATNDLDKGNTTDDSILTEYKKQQNVERGFRFLKDPWFMLDKVFLKSKSRIEALTMVMTLCLLVYNYSQHYLRAKLQECKAQLPNQLGKLIQNPTMRWIYQIMTGVSIVRVHANDSVTEIVTNMDTLRKKIISLFSASVQVKYGFM